MKSLEELENDFWQEPKEFQTNLVAKCHQYRKIPLNQLSVEQMRLLISQEIGLKFLIPLSLNKLKDNIIAEGDMYEGDLLIATSKIPMDFWKQNQVEYSKFKELIQSKCELITKFIGAKKYDEITNRIKASA